MAKIFICFIHTAGDTAPLVDLVTFDQELVERWRGQNKSSDIQSCYVEEHEVRS